MINCFTVMDYSGNSFYSKTYHEEHCWNPGVQHGSRTKRHYTLQKPLAGRMWGGLLRKQLTPCRPAALSRRMWVLPLSPGPSMWEPGPQHPLGTRAPGAAWDRVKASHSAYSYGCRRGSSSPGGHHPGRDDPDRCAIRGICFCGSFNPKRWSVEPGRGVADKTRSPKKRVWSPPARGRAGAQHRCGLRASCSGAVAALLAPRAGAPTGVLEGPK